MKEFIGTAIGFIQGDTRSLDCGSYHSSCLRQSRRAPLSKGFGNAKVAQFSIFSGPFFGLCP